MWAHPGKQLLFMGSEFGQDSEWAESRSLDWWHLDDPAHRGILQLVTDLNARYQELDALWSLDVEPTGFQWIDANDASGNVLSFLRYGRPGAGGRRERRRSRTRAPSASALACVVNFSGAPHHGYRIGLPRGGYWREVLNTDAEGYGGSGVGNLGGVEAVAEPWHGQPFSATARRPARSVRSGCCTRADDGRPVRHEAAAVTASCRCDGRRPARRVRGHVVVGAAVAGLR